MQHGCKSEHSAPERLVNISVGPSGFRSAKTSLGANDAVGATLCALVFVHNETRRATESHLTHPVFLFLSAVHINSKFMMAASKSHLGNPPGDPAVLRNNTDPCLFHSAVPIHGSCVGSNGS